MMKPELVVMKPELVVTTMSVAEARALTIAIRRHVSGLSRCIGRAFHGRVWLALGYGTWEEYVNGEGLKTKDVDVIRKLAVEEQMSPAAIAPIADVDRSTIERQHGRAAHVDASAVGLDGRRRPKRRAHADEIERRRDIVEQLWRDRYGRDDIADALGVSHGTIAEDLIARGVDRRERRGPKRTTKLPARIAWRDGDTGDPPPKSVRRPRPRPITPPSTEPDWTLNRTVPVLRLFHESFVGDRLANQLAHSIHDAVAAVEPDAQAWLVDVHDLLMQVAADVHQLIWIERDVDYRRRCMQHGDADVPPPGPLGLDP